MSTVWTLVAFSKRRETFKQFNELLPATIIEVSPGYLDYGDTSLRGSSTSHTKNGSDAKCVVNPSIITEERLYFPFFASPSSTPVAEVTTHFASEPFCCHQAIIFTLQPTYVYTIIVANAPSPK